MYKQLYSKKEVVQEFKCLSYRTKPIRIFWCVQQFIFSKQSFNHIL